MKKIYSFIAALLLSVTAFGATFNLFTPATGVLKGNASTYVTTAATSSDIYSLWTGTCNNTTYLRGDGSCQVPPGAGGGTVNSVALSAPSVFGVSGSPVTSTGTLALSFATGQTANSFLATPDGTTGALSLRSILLADLPTITVAKGGTGAVTLTGYVKGNGTSAMTASASVPVADISGTLPVANGGTGVTSSTGTGSAVLSTSPTLVTPLLGTPTSGVMTNVTGLPLTTGVTGLLPVANGGIGIGTLTGIAKGNGTSAFSVANSGDVIATWGGTCSASTYLRGDGSCQTPATGGTGANPSALVGLTAVNGAAGTFLRSDGAPALDQSIAPTWTGVHTFSGAGARVAFTGAGTSSSRIDYSSTGGALAVGLDGSGGDSIVTGGSAYAGTFATTNATGLTFGTNSLARQTISSGGNVTINSPSSGTALTVAGTTGGITPVRWTDSAGTTVGFLGASSTPSIDVGSVSNHPFNIFTNSTARIGVSNAGNVTVNAPSSGTGLAVNAANASTAALDIASGHLKIAGSAGTSGQVLTSGGASAAPSWTSTAASILSGGSAASDGAGGCTLTTNATVGVTSCAVSSTVMTITFTNAAPHFWACSASNESSSNAFIVNTGRVGTTTATIRSLNLTSTGPITWSTVNPSTTAITYSFTCQPV